MHIVKQIKMKNKPNLSLFVIESIFNNYVIAKFIFLVIASKTKQSIVNIIITFYLEIILF